MDAVSGVRKRRHRAGSRTCEHLQRDHLIPLQESHAAHAPCCNRTMRRSDHRCDGGPCVRLPRERADEGGKRSQTCVDVSVRVRLLVNTVV
jgi:hypothetical protein